MLITFFAFKIHGILKNRAMNEDLSTPLRSSFDGNSDANTIPQSGSPQKSGGKLGTVLGLFDFDFFAISCHFIFIFQL